MVDGAKSAGARLPSSPSCGFGLADRIPQARASPAIPAGHEPTLCDNPPGCRKGRSPVGPRAARAIPSLQPGETTEDREAR